MRRILAGCSALLVVAGAGAVAVDTVPASASQMARCAKFTGTTAGPVKLSSCRPLTLTGGSGTLKITGTTGCTDPSCSSFKIKWVNGKTTSGTSTTMVVSPSTCPNLQATEELYTIDVTGGTLTELNGGSGYATVCVRTGGAVTLLTGTTYVV